MSSLKPVTLELFSDRWFEKGYISTTFLSILLYICILIENMNPDEVSESKEGVDIAVGPVPSDGAAADIKDIRPFLKYFNDLVATEVYAIIDSQFK